MLLIANTQSVFHSFLYATDKTLIERLVYFSSDTVPGVSLPAAHETGKRRGQAVYGQRRPLQRVTGAMIKGNGATARSTTFIPLQKKSEPSRQFYSAI